MFYADTIRAAGLDVEPLMAWFLPWIIWLRPPNRFDLILDISRDMDFRLRGARQLRVFDSSHYLDVLDSCDATSDTGFGPGGKPPLVQRARTGITRYVVESRRDMALLRIVPYNDPGYLAQPDKVGLLVAVDTEKDILIESKVLCERSTRDRPASGDNVVAYCFPDHRDPLLIMGIESLMVGETFGWDIKRGETVIVERFRTIDEFTIRTNRESGTITIDGQSFDVSNVRIEEGRSSLRPSPLSGAYEPWAHKRSLQDRPNDSAE